MPLRLGIAGSTTSAPASKAPAHTAGIGNCSVRHHIPKRAGVEIKAPRSKPDRSRHGNLVKTTCIYTHIYGCVYMYMYIRMYSYIHAYIHPYELPYNLKENGPLPKMQACAPEHAGPATWTWRA